MRKYGDTLLITPAKSKVQILRDKIKQRVQSALGQTQEELVWQLNPLLRGWANYFRHGAAKATFSKLDYYVFCRLWRWATRRHPDKTRAWKKRKYFSASKDGNFSVEVHGKNGEPRVLALYRLVSTPIQRHIKVKGTANPYDPRYTDYFAKRRFSFGRIRGGGWPTISAVPAV